MLSLLKILVGRVLPKMEVKNLAVFDFDHTVIDDNSDTAIIKLIDKSKISSELKQLYKAEGWTAYMQGIFEVLHENKVRQTDIDHLIKNIPEVQGMRTLFTELHDHMNYDIIIISDSNTHFIRLWLETNNLDSTVFKVFSNPAHFNDDGLLCIKMYHFQEVCNLSTNNLCKGMILEDFIKSQLANNVKYERVIYVGDGYNDLCPMLRLNKQGIACARDKYKCSILISKLLNGESIDESGKNNHNLESQVFIWENGVQILDFVKNL